MTNLTNNKTTQSMQPIRLSVLDAETQNNCDATAHDSMQGLLLDLSAHTDPGDPFSRHKILNHFDKLLAVANGKLAFPVTVEIDPSNICNHRCPWCVSSAAHGGESISLDCIKQMTQHLADLDVKSIVLKGGGEPTVHPQFNEILSAITEQNMTIGIITNGSMIRPGTPKAILEHAKWVRISLDAATTSVHRQIHGSADFDNILDNIKTLANTTDSDTLVGLNFVAEPTNHKEIFDFAQLGKDLGVGYVSIRCVFDADNPLPKSIRQTMRAQASMAKTLENENFRVFLGNFSDQYLNADAPTTNTKQKCLGPNLVGVIGADGETYACCFLRGYKDFSFGNINDQSFEDIWQSDKRKQVMNKVYEGNCKHVCAGGMTANRYNLYNEILNYLALENKPHGEFV